MTDENITEFQWVEKLVRLEDLKPYERNPRTITESQFDKLKQSLSEDGYHSRIKVTHDLLVIGGHQRIRALRELGYTDIAVLMPDRAIPFEQFKRILIRDNHHAGVFDMDMLANDFDLEELRSWGVHDILNIPPLMEDAPPPSQDPDDAQRPETVVRCPGCAKIFKAEENKV